MNESTNPAQFRLYYLGMKAEAFDYDALYDEIKVPTNGTIEKTPREFAIRINMTADGDGNIESSHRHDLQK